LRNTKSKEDDKHTKKELYCLALHNRTNIFHSSKDPHWIKEMEEEMNQIEKNGRRS